MVGVIAASAAVSAVALGQGSTWGTSTPSAPDASPSSDSDASAPSAPDAAPAAPADAGPKPRAAASAPASASPDQDAGAGDGGAYEPSTTGFSIGLRGGYMVPFGQANDVPLNGGVVVGVVPIGGDVGWFFSPHFYLGGYFQYGFGVGPGQNNLQCSELDTSCSAEMYRFGVVAHYHFKPEATWDPWVGAGLGYEIVNLVATSDVDESTVTSSALQGLDVTIEAGLDLKPLRYFGVGPYVELATGPYLGTSTFAMHGWGSFGLRFRTNL
jgi:hypothetical protein